MWKRGAAALKMEATNATHVAHEPQPEHGTHTGSGQGRRSQSALGSCRVTTLGWSAKPPNQMTLLQNQRDTRDTAHRMMLSVTRKIKPERGGCTSGGGEVSVFNTVLRKASLGWNISAGPEKSDSKSQRRSERTLCVWTRQWPSEETHSPGRL